MVPTVKYGAGSIMIWGYMTADGVGEMSACEGRMNSQKYINVLETVLMLSLRSIFDNTNLLDIMFQQHDWFSLS